MKRNSHAKTLVITLVITALIVIGQKAFSTLFFTTFMVLFLAPIVIFARAIRSMKQYKIMMENYYNTYSMEDAFIISDYLVSKKYHAGVDRDFFMDLRALYASVGEQEWSSQEFLDHLEKGMLNYGVKLENAIETTTEDELIVG